MANYTRSDLTGVLAPVNAELEKVATAIVEQLDREPVDGEANQMEINLDMNSFRVINVATPQTNSDAATKKYCDDKAASNAETPKITITKFNPVVTGGLTSILVEDLPDTLNVYVNGVMLLESDSDYTYNIVTGIVTLTTALLLADDVEIQYGAVASDVGGGLRTDVNNNVILADTTLAPTGTPASGGILYVEAGALKFKGSGGTVTTIASA